MECANHPGVEPAARCVSCGKFLCSECMLDRGRMYCRACGELAPERVEFVTMPCEPPERSSWLEGIEPGRSFSFMLDDPDWLTRFLIGVVLALLSFLIVPFLMIMGYMLEVMRMAEAGDDHRLPPWDLPGKKLKEGAIITAIALLYAIPLYVIVGGTTVLGTLAGGVHGPGQVFAVLLFALGWLMSLVILLMLVLVFPAVAQVYASSGSFKESFRLKKVFGHIEECFKQRMVVLAITIVVFLFFIPLGLMACGVGVFVTAYYALLVVWHLFGQLARTREQREAEGGAPDA